MDRDDFWIVEHFSELVTKYAGKYVAVVNETLVAVGDFRRDVETKAREVEPAKIPSVLRVPREEDMVCLLSSLFLYAAHTRSWFPRYLGNQIRQIDKFHR